MKFINRFKPELLLLTALSFLTRFWNLFSPRSVVFDEIYFKAYGVDYLSGKYYFDPHPPLGKLLLGGFAKLAGVNKNLSDTDPAVAMRLLPALAGALIIPVVYVLLRQLKASRRVATLGAALILLDNALLVESRFILVDSMLILFTLGSLSAWLAGRKRKGKSAWSFYILGALLAGAACSTKLTGLTAPALIGVILLWDAWKTKRYSAAVIRTVSLVAISFLVYLGTFWVHFRLLPNSGQGDAFMSQKFQSTLVGNYNYDPSVHMNFWDKFVDLNRAMLNSEKSLESATHPYGSKWYTWPLALRPVYYWVGTSGSGTGYIYMAANPLIWWGVIVGALFILSNLISNEKYRKRSTWGKYLYGCVLLFVGYLANWLPFSHIKRVMFMYHYLIALCFSIGLISLCLGVILGWNEDPEGKPWAVKKMRHKYIYIGILAIAFLSFLYFAPLTYGSNLSSEGLNSRMWLGSWR